MGETCTVCGKACRGGFEVYSRNRDVPVIVIDSTPDRNFNVCDLCNCTICFDCSTNPDSGYCNECLEKTNADEHD